MDSRARLRGVDRISDLPDAIVCHILSFLPTIYAVLTSLVSRRWANLWKSLPNLDFDNQDFPAKLTDRFARVVDRLLYFRGSSDIRKLRLHIKQCENLSSRDFSRILRCIRSAIRHNIVELDLLLLFRNHQTYGLEMPQRVFMCKTLEVLTVYSDLISYPPPTTGCFPSLKVLHVSVFGLDHGSLDKLFSYCPVLEDLTLDGIFPYCQFLNINISAPELKTLKIWLHNSIENGGSCLNKFFIAAPKLENLELTNSVSSYYYLESTKSLRRARIQFKYGERDRKYGFGEQDDHVGFATRATALLAEICNVKYLYLETHARSHCLEVSICICSYLLVPLEL